LAEFRINSYSLTLLRLSALIWMGLVAAGIVLILWRITFGKSGRWLINANALAATVLLYIAAFLDLSGLVAHYNVRHAYEITGRGAMVCPAANRTPDKSETGFM
jgi:hypothetical protein